ncbi:MAG: hypothetical protein KJ058_13845 [Thermoanaerobaculia bacterium]|nr:hypothetical protein [Thermoanaerobaculia bacterium]
MDEIRIEVAGAPERALAAVAAEAEAWGAGWEGHAAGGRLGLPALFGLRRGVVTGEIAVAPRPAGSGIPESSEIAWHHLRSELHLHRPAVAILALAAAAGLGTLLWPFFPVLIRLVPAAILLSLSAWWLVVSRLRTAGPREFLDAVRARLAGEGG